MKIKLNVGIGDALAAALGLRQGRPQFDQALSLDSNVVPVVLLASGAAASPSVTSTPTADVDAGVCFVGFANPIAGGAGNLSMAQVFNPIGSGRTVWLDHASCNVLAGGGISLRRYDVALATLVGALSNRKFSGVGSAAQLRTQNNTALPGGTVELCNAPLWAPSAGSQQADFDTFLRWPLKLDPGQGVMITNNAGNATMQANFGIREYPA